MNVEINSTCPYCNHKISMDANIDHSVLAPPVRCGIKPAGNIQVYRINSEMIKHFIVEKSRRYCPEAKIEVIPKYCERKRRHNSEPHRAYASLRIAFSEDIIEKKKELGWYGTIGENSDNLRFQPSMFANIIRKYQYQSKDISSWLKSYKMQENLEEAFGMNEAFIHDIQMYARPQAVKANDGSIWVIFSAAAENVIEDMLTDYKTNTLPGKMEIRDIYPLSKDIVEFLIYMHPLDMKMQENPHVRQILLGEEKGKK